MNARNRTAAALATVVLIALQAAAIAPGPENVSLATGGALASGNDCYEGSVTPNGRWVAFDSGATNLGLAHSAGDFQVFLRDRKTGILVHVSKDPAGLTAGNGSSYDPCISANGRRIVYYSNSDNLAAGDLDSGDDLFLYDVRTGANSILPVNADGVPADGTSQIYGNALSQNGRWLVFNSNATNLAPGTGAGINQVYLLDLNKGAVTLLSVDPAGIPGNGPSQAPSISPNGKWVVFESNAPNLVAGDLNADRDIFVRDLRHGTTRRVSIGDDGAESNSLCTTSAVSNDGKSVVFRSLADNLAGVDLNGKFDVFLRDDRAGRTFRISQDADGADGDGHSYEACIAANGKTVVYYSYATNLIKGVASAQGGVYLFDRRTATTRQIDLGPAGELPDAKGYVYQASMDPTGKWLTFSTSSTSLAGASTGGYDQMYVVKVR